MMMISRLAHERYKYIIYFPMGSCKSDELTWRKGPKMGCAHYDHETLQRKRQVISVWIYASVLAVTVPFSLAQQAGGSGHTHMDPTGTLHRLEIWRDTHQLVMYRGHLSCPPAVHVRVFSYIKSFTCWTSPSSFGSSFRLPVHSLQ